jgi:hypothetical protein
MGPFVSLTSFLVHHVQLLLHDFVTRKRALPPPKVLHHYMSTGSTITQDYVFLGFIITKISFVSQVA